MLTKTGGAEIHAFFALDERQRTTASNLSRVAGSFRFTDWPCHRGPVIPNSPRFIGLCASKALKHNPDLAPIWLWYGHGLKESGRTAGAESPTSHHNRGKVAADRRKSITSRASGRERSWRVAGTDQLPRPSMPVGRRNRNQSAGGACV
jgi:hypothetical protein